jgi:hypothetical protein
MTAVPSALQPLLETTARAWVGTASSPVSEANALIDAMQAHLHVDPQALPAPGTDAVTQLLQDKRGNVLVWTTTYILLCRALGLPVRLAEGYLPGSIEPDGRTMVVHASDAAIWAQLAIPGVGWMDFFPAGINVSVTIPSKIIYKLQPTPTPQSNSQPTPTISPRHAQPSHPNVGVPSSFVNGGAGTLLIIVLVLAVLFVVSAIFAVLLQVRWARYGQHLAPLPRFFARVALLARLAGIALRSSDTSTQATNKVAAYLPDQATTLQSLNDTYEHMRYGPPGERWALPNLRAQWQHLGASLWRLVMTRPWRRNQSSKVEEKG